MKFLIKDITIRSLVSGDKSARIVLESLDYRDIPEISKLAELLEVEVRFDKSIERE
jgi:hypothetical protein